MFIWALSLVQLSIREARCAWGGWNHGGGAALAHVDGDSRRDLVFARIDAPDGGNSIYYRVGFNVDKVDFSIFGSEYIPTSYGPSVKVPGTIGDRTSGAGVAAGDINGNGRPEIIVVYVDDTKGTDTTWYRIGWVDIFSFNLAYNGSNDNASMALAQDRSDMGIYSLQFKTTQNCLITPSSGVRLEEGTCSAANKRQLWIQASGLVRRILELSEQRQQPLRRVLLPLVCLDHAVLLRHQ